MCEYCWYGFCCILLFSLCRARFYNWLEFHCPVTADSCIKNTSWNAFLLNIVKLGIGWIVTDVSYLNLVYYYTFMFLRACQVSLHILTWYEHTRFCTPTCNTCSPAPWHLRHACVMCCHARALTYTCFFQFGTCQVALPFLFIRSALHVIDGAHTMLQLWEISPDFSFRRYNNFPFGLFSFSIFSLHIVCALSYPTISLSFLPLP